MKIGIIGLGLMGGSIAMKLHETHEVFGFDINQSTIDYAIKHKMIDGGSTCIDHFFSDLEVVYLCLYPTQIVPFIQNNQSFIRPNTVVIDIAGIKLPLQKKVLPILREDIDFVLTHPIAGREKIGIQHAKSSIFHNANYIITPTSLNKESSLEIVESLAKSMGFKTITRVDAFTHDDIIAYTSQLTHAISLALVHSEEDSINVSSFIGDSYRDLTRIAMINEPLWSELFIENKEALLSKISAFQESLSLLKSTIESSDSNVLQDYMTYVKNKRLKIEKG
jgi:prephenate dehydrogenase